MATGTKFKPDTVAEGKLERSEARDKQGRRGWQANIASRMLQGLTRSVKTRTPKSQSPIAKMKVVIVEAIRHFEPEGTQRDVFGDGRAAKRIVEIITSDRYN